MTHLISKALKEHMNTNFGTIAAIVTALWYVKKNGIAPFSKQSKNLGQNSIDPTKDHHSGQQPLKDSTPRQSGVDQHASHVHSKSPWIGQDAQVSFPESSRSFP